VRFLESVTPRFTPAASPEESLLSLLAGVLAPLLAPCGFGTHQAAAALITGLAAKESILSTLAVLAGKGGPESLFPTSLSAFSFLLFTLFYTPCAAAMAAIRRELDDPGAARAAGVLYLLAAWAVSCIVYQLGSLLC
jgi:ferrous iron transport protein B